jgi:hypothetical protein
MQIPPPKSTAACDSLQVAVIAEISPRVSPRDAVPNPLLEVGVLSNHDKFNPFFELARLSWKSELRVPTL